MKLDRYILFQLIFFYALFETAYTQFLDQTGRSEWIIKDTSVSAPFIQSYIRYASKLKPDNEDNGTAILENDRIVVQIGISDGKTEIQSLKVLARDGALTDLDSRIVQGLDQKLVTRIKERKYSWDEFDKSQLKDQRYASDIETIFELRNYKTTRDIFWWSSSTIQFTFPSSVMLRLGERLGAEITLNNDEYGYIYPFLIGNGPGILRVGFAHQIGKAYIIIPVRINGNNLEGSYGGGLTLDDGSFGGGFMLQDLSFKVNGYKETHITDTYDTTTLSLQNAGYVYLSKTHDISKILNQSTLRWKVGASFMGYNFVTQIYDNKDGNFLYQPEIGLYMRFEMVNGFLSDYNQWEFALQSIISNHRHFLLSATYNFDNWLGVECKIASITPADNWRSAFSLTIQPKIRL